MTATAQAPGRDPGRAPATDDRRRQIAAEVRRLHDPRAIHPGADLAWNAVHAASFGLVIVAFHAGAWLAVGVVWVWIAWLNHAALCRLHEAVHGMLARRRGRNEALGVAIGTLAFTPMSVYRDVHRRHHAHLGTREDPEFRPYNDVAAPRAVRLGYAIAELVLGAALTPLLYSLRTARTLRSMPAARRRRLAFEWTLLFVFWVAAFAVAIAAGRIVELTVAFLVPAWLTGVGQTVRKFVEHLGRHGDTIPARTRTVAYRSALGRLLSWTQLHVDHHGTHHRWPRIPWRNLPRATPLLEEIYGVPPFASHGAAIRDMLPALLDPKVGPQWTGDRADPRSSRQRQP